MNNGVKISKAIKKINPDAEFVVQDNSIDRIEWVNGTTPISKSDIEAKMSEVQSEYDALDYSRKRANEYPAIVEQLDDIYHNGIEGWKATIKVTKDKYPKG
jgi:hypothetical protein